MKILKVEDYNEFECIGDQCSFSCCGGGWRIAIDKASMSNYLAVEGEFGEKLRNNIKEENGIYSFMMNSKGNCAFLDENRLCEIYRTLGPDKLCEVCKTYPRCGYQVGDILFRFLSTNCPEVVRRIFQRREPMFVDFGDVVDSSVEEEKTNIDWDMFNYSVRAYSTGMTILQNRDYDIMERMALLMVFVKKFQDEVRGNGNPSALIELFSKPELYATLLTDLPIYERNDLVKLKMFKLTYENMKKMTFNHALWKKYNKLSTDILSGQTILKEELDDAFSILDEVDIQLEIEQIATYKFFSNFMLGLEKKDYFERLFAECVKLSAFLSFVVYSKVLDTQRCSQEERILFYSLCSRANDEMLHESIRQEGLCSLDNIFKMISL